MKLTDSSGTFVDYSDETVVDNVKDKITSVGKVGDSNMIPTYATKGSNIGGDEFVYSSCKTGSELVAKNKEYLGLNYPYTQFTSGPLGGTTVSTNLMSMESFCCPSYRSKVPFGNVIIFKSDLPSLTNGYYLFYQNNLTSFTGNLDKLSNGYYMFSYNYNLSDFASDLPQLTNGQGMFFYCTGLTCWNINLPSLTYGRYMFSGCSGLTSFSSDLPSLTDGTGMFSGCKLDKTSVLRILNTIPTYDGSTTHTINIGASTACEGDAEIQSAIDTATNTKHWTVSISYNS